MYEICKKDYQGILFEQKLYGPLSVPRAILLKILIENKYGVIII